MSQAGRRLKILGIVIALTATIEMIFFNWGTRQDLIEMQIIGIAMLYIGKAL